MGSKRVPVPARSPLPMPAPIWVFRASITTGGPGSTGGKTNRYSSHLRECRAVSQRSAGDLSAWVDSHAPARSAPAGASTPWAGWPAPGASGPIPASGPPARSCGGTGTRPSPGPPGPPCPATVPPAPPPGEAAVSLAALPAAIPAPGRRSRDGTSQDLRSRGGGPDGGPGAGELAAAARGTRQAGQAIGA
jgi:hypothetical protein